MDNTRTRNVIKNTRYGMLNKLIAVVFAFCVRTIFINQLGAEYLGVEGIFVNILSLLSLAELGVGNVLIYSLYSPISNNDSAQINALLYFYRRVYLLIATFVTIIGISWIPFLKFVIDINFTTSEITRFYLLYLGNSIVSYIAVCYSTLIKANQEQYLIDAVNCFTKIIVSVAQIIVLLKLKSFEIYLVIAILSTVLQNIIISTIAKNKYEIEISACKIDVLDKKRIIDNTKSTFLYKMSVVLINATDNVLISVLVGTIVVGYFANYMLIVNQVNSVIAIVCVSLISSIGNLLTEDDKKLADIVFYRLLFFFHYVAGLFFVGFSLLLNDVICLWLGNNNLLDNNVCFAIAFSFYIQNMINPVWMYREAYGLFREIKYVMLLTALINIVLSVVLGNKYGVTGIVIATGISRIITTVWYEPKVLYRTIFHKSTSNYYLTLVKYIICTLTAFGGCKLTVFLLPNSSNCLSIVLKILIVFFEFSFIFIVMNHSSDEFHYWKSFCLNGLNVIRK